MIDLAQRIAPRESSTGQYYANGSIVQSSTGALGAMQVEPSNANGNDLLSTTGNVTAGEQLLIHLYAKYNGDQRLVAMAYNWGEGRVDDYLAGNRTVPASVQAYANDVTSGLAAAPATGAGGAVSNTQTDEINQALQKAHGTVAAQGAQLGADIAQYQRVIDLLKATGQVGSDSWNQVSEALATASAKLDNLNTPLGQLSATIEDNRLASQRMEAAYNDSYAAVAKTTAGNQAYAEAIKLVGRNSADFDGTVSSLTAEYLKAADAANKTALAQQTLSNGDQLEYLKAETDSLGENDATRTEMLAHLKAEQELRQKNVDELSTEGQAYLASVDAISAQSAALAKNQQTISDLENLATQAFDQVGSAITNAFAQGGKSALDFGNLARTVLSSVLSELVKVSALNPLLNSLFGGSRTTLGDIGGLLGGAGGIGGILSFAGTGGAAAATISSTDPFAGAGTSGSGAGWGGSTATSSSSGSGGIGNLLSLGGLLWGNGGVGSALGLNGGIGGALGLTGAGGLLNTSLWGGASSGELGLLQAGGIPATASAGTTLGGLLGGAGLGFGAGSLLNSLIGGNSLGGTIGSGVGGLAGAAIGSIIPGVGTILGGLLGGAGGGLLGGLFGNSHPSDKTEGYNEDLQTGKRTATGNAIGTSEYSQSNSAAASGLADTITAAVQGIASAFSLTTGTGGQVVTKVGANGITARLSNQGAPTTSADFSAAGAATVTNGTVGSFVDRLGSALDATTATLLKEIDYSKSSAGQQIAALAAATGGTGKLDATQLLALPNINTKSVSSATSELDWVKNTYEATINSALNKGSLSTQIDAVNKSFDDLIAHATRLGLSTAALAVAQTSQIAAVNAAAQQTIAASGSSILAAYQKQNGDTLGSNLTSFDQSASTAQLQLTAEFKGLFGDSYATQADYVKQVGLLTSTLAAQRSDLIATWREQQQAQNDSIGAGWVANITAGWKAQASIASYSTNLGVQQWGQQLNQAADLQNFDAQAKSTTDAYSSQLLTAYGQSYATTATYAQQMVDLEQSLAEQRLAIQASYAQQAKAQQSAAEQSASGLITGLTGYANSLEQGSTSPLNAQSQYALAQSQYASIAQRAQGGDVTALGELQQYASAFLSASQNLYGSGTQYATDFSSVLAALQAVASIPQNTLTASFMQAALEDQTTILSGNLTDLLGALRSIQVELQQQSAKP